MNTVAKPIRARRDRLLAAAAATGLLFLLGGAIDPTPAAAAGLGGCSYPYVCLYNSGQAKVGQFQDVTTYYQGLSRTDVTYAFNTRRDDTAYFRYSSGRVSCVEPGRTADLRIAGWGYVTGIRIDDRSRCS